MTTPVNPFVLDADAEGVVFLDKALAREVTARLDGIERAKPDWVRVCKGKNHFVALMTAARRSDGTYRCSWQCTRCGKDRR